MTSERIITGPIVAGLNRTIILALGISAAAGLFYTSNRTGVIFLAVAAGWLFRSVIQR